MLPEPAPQQPFNFLAGLSTAAPARAPIEVKKAKPNKFLNILGRVADAMSAADNGPANYAKGVQAQSQRAEAEATQTAIQRLAADPDDQEAFTFLASRDPKGAVDFRNSLRPAPKYEKVGNELVEVGPGGVRSVFKGEATPASPSGDIQLLDRLTTILGSPQKALEYMANLKLPPELKTLNRGDGGQEAFLFDRAPAVPGAAPRGIRNNNAGNLKDGPFARSQPGYKGADADGFAVFEDANAGTRAQVNLLQQRYFGRGLNTPAAIVNTYAPPGPENSGASVANYTNFIARKLGIGPNDPIPPGRVVELAQAMQEFENGTGAASGGPGVRRVAQTPDKTVEPGKDDKAKPDPAGKARIGSTLAGLAQTYLKLDEMAAVPSAERGLFSNARNFAAGTGVGQLVGRATGSEAQRLRERVAISQPAIISQLKQLTGMSAQQMNSNVELQFFMNMATNPTADIEASLFAIDQLDKLYGPGDTLRKTLPPKTYERIQRAGIGLEVPRNNMTFVTSPEQAKALPPGTQFMSPDGKIRVKR